MKKVLVTIVGHDRPGIIHLVSQALTDNRVEVVEVSQTTLLGEFAGLFSCSMAKGSKLDELTAALNQTLDGSGLAHWVAEVSENGPAASADNLEPYVVTVRGCDQAGLIPRFSGCMAGFDANVDNLRSVALTGEGILIEGPGCSEAEGQHQVIMFFELSVPKEVSQAAFRQALNLIAEELNMELSLQHRDIFEAIHRL